MKCSVSPFKEFRVLKKSFCHILLSQCAQSLGHWALLQFKLGLIESRSGTGLFANSGSGSGKKRPEPAGSGSETML